MLTKIKAKLKAGDIDDKEITAADHWRDHRLRRVRRWTATGRVGFRAAKDPWHPPL